MPERYSRKPNSYCVTCRIAIYRRPSEIQSGKVFCSSECNGKANRKVNYCLICSAPILAHQNKKTCSRSCANRHRAGLRYRIGRPKDKAKTFRAIKLKLLAARGAYCERCEYAIAQVLHVHHKDRNRENNNQGNLEILCPNCHYEEHYLEKSWLNSTLIF